MPAIAAPPISQRSLRRTRRPPSRPYVKAEKRTAPTAKRSDEYASGSQPCVRAYLTTVKLKLQKSTVARRRTSGGIRWRKAPKATCPKEPIDSARWAAHPRGERSRPPTDIGMGDGRGAKNASRGGRCARRHDGLRGRGGTPGAAKPAAGTAGALHCRRPPPRCSGEGRRTACGGTRDAARGMDDAGSLALSRRPLRRVQHLATLAGG